MVGCFWPIFFFADHRYTRLANRAYQVALYTVFYNFYRIHRTLRVSSAVAAGVTDTLREVRWIVGLVEARTPPPGRTVPEAGEALATCWAPKTQL